MRPKGSIVEVAVRNRTVFGSAIPELRGCDAQILLRRDHDGCFHNLWWCFVAGTGVSDGDGGVGDGDGAVVAVGVTVGVTVGVGNVGLDVGVGVDAGAPAL